MSAPLRIAVVGHTNVGKTSLLRTLTRNTGFGEVSARPSTTRHVQGARMEVDGQALLELYDTPGLEDPIALLTLSDSLDGRGRRSEGVDRIRALLDDPQSHARFEQECKVLRQVLQSDVALYVIDSRDAVLAKHRDELQLLSLCAVPILPVLNFLRDPRSEEASWRETLARCGLHALVRFDSVAPERDAEERLYRAIATLLQRGESALNTLLAARSRDAELRRAAVWRVVAAMLVDVAMLRATIVADDVTASALAETELRAKVRLREQALVNELLRIYRFDLDCMEAAELPLHGGSWGSDPFDAAALALLGQRLGKGIAAGAAAGVGIDLAVGGITLGAAALGGALLGGGLQTARHYGRRMLDRARGRRVLRIEPAVLAHLLLRARHLVAALEARGHGATKPLSLHGESEPAAAIRLPAPLREAMHHPEWSADSTQRDAAIGRLAETMGHADLG